MLRILVVRFWPVLLPIFIYLLWLVLARRKARKAGEEGPRFFDGPWAWSVMASLGIFIALFVLMGAASQQALEQGRYVPAKMVDGKLVPAHHEPE